ncbi:transcriptional regulator NanR [Alsobacter sp. SYSU M60028]|uniref:Transcriptional regulator NanR n=1 Tax=Alsobacter ponti TaxID=2962936 RepID=A0ABT1L8D4_9HYPH|nr:transcriptional regulator NanR [Alsobacter ponti]MCP8937770.1 transcriptional regulator NanR [Alsobacter ponti]
MARQAVLGPVRKRKLSDQVAERLETAIRSGAYKPGASLPPERELMALFGVGRPSVREALFALQKMGLVQLGAGERPKVVRPSPKHLLNELGAQARRLLEQPQGLDHFEQARLALEVFLVTHACSYATPADIEALRAALAANEAAIGAGPEFVATDVAFHRALAEMPRNPIFVALHDAVVEWIINERPILPNVEANNRKSYADHAAILAAIERRDMADAVAAMTKHLNDARARYVSP